MQIAGSGRFFFILQWVAAVMLPAFVFLGRGFVGAELGWMAIIGIVYGIFVILLMLVPAILTLFDRDVRKARATRTAYGIATLVLWIALVLAGLTIPDSGDSGHLRSAFSVWFGMSYEASSAVFSVAFAVAVAAWVASVVLAIVGIVRSVAVSRAAAAAG